MFDALLIHQHVVLRVTTTKDTGLLLLIFLDYFYGLFISYFLLDFSPFLLHVELEPKFSLFKILPLDSTCEERFRQPNKSPTWSLWIPTAIQADFAHSGVSGVTLDICHHRDGHQVQYPVLSLAKSEMLL